MNDNVFEYKCLKAYFNFLLVKKKNINSSYSLRAWSKSLGYNNPAFISQCLNGIRTINRELLSRVVIAEKINGPEELYLTILFYKHHADEKDFALFDGMLELIRTGKSKLTFNEGCLSLNGLSLGL